MADQVADLPPENHNLEFLLIDSRAQADQVADHVADLPTSRGILWPRVELTLVQLT